MYLNHLAFLFLPLLTGTALGGTLTLRSDCSCQGAAFYCTVTLDRDDGAVFALPAEVRLDRQTPEGCSDYLFQTQRFDGLTVSLDADQSQRDAWEFLPGLERAHFCYAAGGSNMACDLDLTAYLLVNPREGIKANDGVAYRGIYVAGIDPALEGAADLAAYAALGSKTGLYGTVALSRRTMLFRKAER